VYACEHCHQQAAHHLIKRTRKITLFFVPLFPVSTRYLDVCTFCGRDLQIGKDRAEAALRQPAA
jgi:hypothetical protein